MKCLSFLALLPLFAACASDKGFELPTLAVGSGGARFLTEENTPHDAYNKAYAAIVKKQREIDETGSDVTTNPIFVKNALESIVHNLKVMQGLLATPDPSEMDSLVAFYTGMNDRAQKGQLRLGTATKKKLHLRGREVPRHFSPVRVTLRATEERIIRAPESKPPVDTDVEYRLLCRAWSGAHESLVEAFRKREKGAAAFEEVETALEKISGMLPGEKANALLVYRRFYTKIHEETAGFTRSPEGAKDEDVLNDLRIVFSGIQRELGK